MTEVSTDRRPRPLLAGLVTAGVTALWAWQWTRADNAPCASQAVMGCSGTPIALLVIGVPLGLLSLYLVLRWCGARNPALGVLACPAALVVLPALTEAMDPPMWIWPVVLGVVATLYTAFSRR
ncbi:MAG TPA: hypothetical protein VN088_18455 [Nocardioides sp.]|nr:hypothetical protein [Nocardioides sp.]